MATNTAIKPGKLYGIGIGPGDPDLLTIKAAKALEKADVILVPKSKEQASTALNIVKAYIPAQAKIEQLEFSMNQDIKQRIDSRKKNAALISKQLDEGKTLLFLTLGDPMLYSTYSYVLEHLHGNYNTETIPGIYSFSAISSLLSLPLCKGDDKLTVISSFNHTAEKIIELTDTVVLMKLSAYNNKLYNYLKDKNNYNFVMISDAGKANQKTYTSIEVLKEKVPYFSTAILQKTV